MSDDRERGGLFDAISSNVTAAGGPMTEEEFYAGMRAVMRDAARLRPVRCPPHLISPRARPGGWTWCSWCAGPVKVPEDWGR